jgi:hypothetical protein
LRVEGPVVPNLVAQADGLEEVEVHGGGADDGHVGALLEVAARLGRRRERQAKVLGCTYVNFIDISDLTRRRQLRINNSISKLVKRK